MLPGALWVCRSALVLLRRVSALAFATLWAEPVRVRGPMWTTGFYCRLFGGGWLAVSAVCDRVSPAIALLGVAWWIEKFLALKSARVEHEVESTSEAIGANLEHDD